MHFTRFPFCVREATVVILFVHRASNRVRHTSFFFHPRRHVRLRAIPRIRRGTAFSLSTRFSSIRYLCHLFFYERRFFYFNKIKKKIIQPRTLFAGPRISDGLRHNVGGDREVSAGKHPGRGIRHRIGVDG